MVEVVTEVTHKTAEQGNSILAPLFQNFFVLIFIAIIIGLAVAVYYIWNKRNDDQFKRDHPIYEAHANAVESCKLNANHKWIYKKYSLKNLFILGFPVFYNDHSSKIRDKDDHILGFYRGHFYGQDGYLYLLLYKTKSWFIIENVFILRCPISVNMITKEKDDKGGFVYRADGKTIKTKEIHFNFANNVSFEQNKDIKINCLSVETFNYFTYPVYVSGFGEAVDLRKIIGESSVELGYGVLVAKIFEDGARMSRKGMEFNSSANYEKTTPEKTKEETTK